MRLPPRRFHLSAAVAGPSGQQGPRGPPSAPRHTHSRARHIHTHRPELQTWELRQQRWHSPHHPTLSSWQLWSDDNLENNNFIIQIYEEWVTLVFLTHSSFYVCICICKQLNSGKVFSPMIQKKWIHSNIQSKNGTSVKKTWHSPAQHESLSLITLYFKM